MTSDGYTPADLATQMSTDEEFVNQGGAVPAEAWKQIVSALAAHNKHLEHLFAKIEFAEDGIAAMTAGKAWCSEQGCF